MKNLVCLLILPTLLFSCGNKNTFDPRNFTTVEVETIFYDSILNIRAIDILNDGSLAFAANEGVFGLYNPKKDIWQTSVQAYDSLNLEFRAIAHTATDFFMLSIDNPALLFKTGNQGKMELVYEEHASGVFYNALSFWNDEEGIAVGDSMNGCLSIIITRDGGHNWEKLSCSNLPKAEDGESSFASSNTDIKIVGNKVWVATTSGNVYVSEDKGITWDIIKTPIANTAVTEGIYSIDFYDELNGFAIGGDYENPEANMNNKIRTVNGGKTWELVAINNNPGYRSCVQYVPNGEGKELVAIGFKGIDFSNDSGTSWKHLSDEHFYTIRFINDSVAYASCTARISKITFRK